MNGGIVPVVLLGCALGLMLSFVDRRAVLLGLVTFAVSMIAAATLLKETAAWLLDPVIGCGIGAAITALCIYLPSRLAAAAAVPLSANAGFWCGIAAGQGTPWQALLFAGLPLAIVVPGHWLVARRWAIVLKIMSGWLIAISVLAAALPMIATPGYEPDHME